MILYLLCCALVCIRFVCVLCNVVVIIHTIAAATTQHKLEDDKDLDESDSEEKEDEDTPRERYAC
jgi:hypothetical protein